MGPMALAGFTPAPLRGPLMRMAAASVDPMAMAATPFGTRLSVVTEMITRTSANVGHGRVSRNVLPGTAPLRRWTDPLRQRPRHRVGLCALAPPGRAAAQP